MNIRTEVLKVSPTLAANMLTRNHSNRPLSQATVNKYASAMKRGEWQLNGEPIIIFKDDGVGNGQHRLHAIVKSGVEIETLVVRGIERETFPTMDGLRPRGAADVLSMSDEKNTFRLASGARCYLSYFMTGRAVNEITPTQILKAVEDHPDIRYWTNAYASRKNMRIIPSAIIGYLAVASEKHGRQKLNEFAEKLGTGVGLCEGDPALLLRERFQAAVQRRTSIAKHIADALMIKAINAHIKGRQLGTLRYGESDAYPVIE